MWLCSKRLILESPTTTVTAESSLQTGLGILSAARSSMKATSITSSLVTVSLLLPLLMPKVSYAEQIVESEPPVQRTIVPPGSEEPCPKGRRGGAIGGIVGGSVFWALLPMSSPVLITQTKKLKAHNKAKRDGRCQSAPGA